MRPVRKVVVVGRDAAAWLTALALRRAFAPAGVAVALVELPSLLDAADVYAALPALAGLHRIVGVEERELVAGCAAVPVGGQRFVGWSGGEGAFVHGYDTQRLAIDDLEFVQYWVKARGEGLRVAWEDFSPAAAAAKQGRIGRGDSDPSALGALQHGYHLDARAYVALIARHALRSGVERLDGFAAVEHGDGRIAAIRLDDGSLVEGDLFVDASGGESVLIEPLADGAFESWSGWLPTDRTLAASAPPLRPLPAFAQIVAGRWGWVALHPLQDRTALVGSFSSEHADEAEMAAELARLGGVPLAGDVVAASVRRGIRPRPWIGNCVAIGEAAVALEALDAVPLHMVHAGISNLVALFPVDAEAMPEASRYASAVAAHARNVRDFQIAHYRLNGRAGEPFWDTARTAEGPESLEAKLALFAARGRLALYDSETFQEQSWTSLFLGQGLIPRSNDATVDKLPPAEQMARFQNLLRMIAGEVRDMPDVDAWLAQATA